MKNKTRNIAEELYDEHTYGCVGWSDFDTFKTTWAGKQWIDRNRQTITDRYNSEKKRFEGWTGITFILGI